MCPSGETCCKQSSGQYGCCPLPKGCSRGGSSQVTELVKKVPALLISENVVCPGGQAMCNPGETCCKLSSGKYGCCPLSKIIFLKSDNVFCPGGEVMCYPRSTCCMLITGQYGCCPFPQGCCRGGSSQGTELVKKVPALLISENVVCPGGQAMCNPGETCCKQSSGQYGCCPLPKKKAPVLSGPVVLRSENVVCPDGQHECRTGQTCCKLASGSYRYCPLPK
ncbi:progranulin-like, partial [Saccostrea cucullata]|uniref:progranulin-like n=1 Tax=Saccostrea cuccullata TaxID=36930 RepID=UPI002ED2F8E7